ncbi:MAG TPA: hypothetical protein VHL99_05955 [Candidatus Binatia bacterium]|jgi:hypothetical protein|nr:hypothetical protein [Candidatus Binatia bacterium]
MNESCDTHTSIRIALPRERCGEVREVVEILSALEDVYNHLYAWHEFAGGDDAEGMHESRIRHALADIDDARDVIPSDRRLCLARIEVEAPAFIEVVGARYPLETIYAYLRSRDVNKRDRSARAVEKIDSVRAEVDHLWASSVSESDIREAVATHVIAPFKRLERLEGIELCDQDETVRAPARRAQRERMAAPLPAARGH